MAGKTTTRFGVDITDLKKGMQEANQIIKLTNSEFKNATADMDDWGSSADGLSAKVKQLSTIEEQQQKKLEILREEYRRIVEAQGENSVGARTLATEINNQEAVIKSTQKELQNYNDKLKEVSKSDIQKGFENLGSKIKNIGTSVKDFVSNGVSNLVSGLKSAGEQATNSANGGFTVLKGVLVDLTSNAIQKATDSLVGFAKQSIETGKNFSSSMSQVGAISGATGEDLELLEKTAREYGATTTFSASESADALKYMALAGWDVEESTSALGGVLNLAAASGMDLAKASDMCTDYMSAFGMESDQAGYFADMLAYAQSNANTTAEGLGEAYKNCAANLNAAGQDVETVTSLLSMMANQGLKGSESGTALAAIMRDLTAKMKDGSIQIGDTAVSVMDANGNYRDLTDILKDVEKATDKMGDAEKATALSTTFTSDSIKGLNLILNAGVDEAEAFEEELRNSKDTAQEMADAMNDNLAGDMKTLNSAIEEVQLKLYDKLEPAMRNTIQGFTDLVGKIDWESLFDKIFTFKDNIVNIITNYVTPAWESLKDNISNVVDNIKDKIPLIKEKVEEIIPVIINKFTELKNKFVEVKDNIVSFVQTYILPILSKFKESGTKIFEAIKNAIKNTSEPLISFKDVFSTIAKVVLPVARDIIEKIVEVLGNLITWIIDNKETVIATLVAIGTGFLAFNVVTMIQGVITVLSALPPILTVLKGAGAGLNAVLSANPIGLIIALLVGIIAYLVHLYNTSEEFRMLVDAIWQKIKEFAGKALEFIGDVIGKIIKFFTETIPNAWNTLKLKVAEFLTDIATNIKEKIDKVKDDIIEFKDNIVSFFSELPEKIKNTGRNMVEGLWNGINDKFHWITDKISEFTTGILDGIKNFFGIHSPSKLFETDIGYNLVYGLANGITKKTSTAVKSMTDLAKATVSPFSDLQANVGIAKNSLSNGISSGVNSGSSSTGGNTTLNFYQTNNSPKALSRLEIYRQSKNLLSFKGA